MNKNELIRRLALGWRYTVYSFAVLSAVLFIVLGPKATDGQIAITLIACIASAALIGWLPSWILLGLTKPLKH